MATNPQTTKPEVKQQTSSVAREIVEYEAEIYRAKRDARAARKMFKTTLGRGLLR